MIFAVVAALGLCAILFVGFIIATCFLSICSAVVVGKLIFGLFSIIGWFLGVAGLVVLAVYTFDKLI